MDCSIVVIGRTGDGKSALCNLISRKLGMPNDPFEESDSASSHTQAPVHCQVETILVKDTPGLMDSSVEKDETNIRRIVEDVRSGGYVNAFILVINEQAPRFDAGMQDAVKLLVDSFGPSCLSQMGFMFTKAFGFTSAEDARAKAVDFATIIRNRTGVSVAHIPAWQVDCHPEKLAEIGVGEAKIAERASKSATALDEMLRWARSKPNLDTSDAVVGEYEQRRKAREAEERRVYEASVISEDIETAINEISRKTTPLYRQEERSKKQWKGGLVPKWGNACKETVHWTENVHYGNRVDIVKREEQRTVQTLGSGKIIHGDWSTLREWTESC